MFSNSPVCGRLIDPALLANERIDLIRSIFSNRGGVEALDHVSGTDAQAFVDVIDEASICIILSLEIGSVESHSNFCPLSVRHWKAWMLSRQISVGGACVLHIRSAAAKPYFRNHSKFRFVTIQRKPHSVLVGLRTCGGVGIRTGRLRPRF